MHYGGINFATMSQKSSPHSIKLFLGTLDPQYSLGLRTNNVCKLLKLAGFQASAMSFFPQVLTHITFHLASIKNLVR